MYKVIFKNTTRALQRHERLYVYITSLWPNEFLETEARKVLVKHLSDEGYPELATNEQWVVESSYYLGNSLVIWEE